MSFLASYTRTAVIAVSKQSAFLPQYAQNPNRSEASYKPSTRRQGWKGLCSYSEYIENNPAFGNLFVISPLKQTTVSFPRASGSNDYS